MKSKAKQTFKYASPGTSLALLFASQIKQRRGPETYVMDEASTYLPRGARLLKSLSKSPVPVPVGSLLVPWPPWLCLCELAQLCVPTRSTQK